MAHIKNIPARLRTVKTKMKPKVRDTQWRILDAIAYRDNASLELDDALKAHWNEHGWVILKKAVNEKSIDRLLPAIERFRKTHSCGSDDQGFGLRIGLLHSEKKESFNVALTPQIQDFARWAFDGPPILFGSLTFDVGTEQEPHIDAAFFYTTPEECSMLGAWTALEDIHPDSGPLFYVDGSHKFPHLHVTEVLQAHPDLAARVAAWRSAGAPADLHTDPKLEDDVYKAYSAAVVQLMEEHNAPKVQAVIEKGDTFIWHGWLIHGGLPRVNRALSRRSMVVHYIKEKSPMWTQQQFFLHGDELDSVPPVSFDFSESPRGQYISHLQAVPFEMGNGHFEA